MTDKHTPGPWLRVDGPDYAEIHAAFRPSSPAVALVGKAEDADLIASAPDMATHITALEAEKAELVEALKALPEPYEYLNMAQLKPIRPFIDALNNWSRRFHTTLAKARQSDEGEA